jgi:hypothetical protein
VGSVGVVELDGADPAFSEGVGHWGADGCFQDLEAFGPEDLVEALYELAASVSDEGSRAGELVAVTKEQVAGRLGRPRSGRVCGDAGVEDMAGGDVNERQDVMAAELVRGWWVSWSSGGMGPVFGYVSLVPSEVGVGCDDPACSVWAGSAAAIAPSRVWSSSLTTGWLVWRRKTVSWWRSTMISRSLERPERTARRARMAMRR